MRTKNSVKNIVVALIGQFFGIILQFISRRVFINMMSTSLLGVNSIFANILSILSLAEMGIGTTITFTLYKPLSEGNHEEIKSIMLFYRNIYRVIAILVSLVGSSIVLFFPILIKENIPNLYLYYFLYLASTVVSYLCAYKRTLIIADQKTYISSLYRYAYIIVLNIAQILVLIYTRSYILYLIVQIVLSWLENVLISKHVDGLYPYLKEEADTLSDIKRKEIFKNIKAMLFHRIGSVVVTNTDNILLSAIVGLKSVAMYANYQLVFSGIKTILTQVFSSVTASVGNLMVEKEKNYCYRLYSSITMITYWIYGVISICLILLLNDLITVWIGDKFIESISYVYILVANFFVLGIREPTNIFKNSVGLFWNDRYKALAEAVLNIILSIIMGIFMGAKGIFLATLISCIFIPFWIEPYILYKDYWGKPLNMYFRMIFKYIVFLILVLFPQYYIANLFVVNSWLELIVKSVVIFVVNNILFLLFVYKSEDFKLFFILIKNLIKNRKGA